MLDLTESELAGDLAVLGDQSEVSSALLPGYEAAKEAIRREMAYATLSDHGMLVERVDWRVDYVTSSNRGREPQVPRRRHITLGYRKGELKDQGSRCSFCQRHCCSSKRCATGWCSGVAFGEAGKDV